VERHRGTAPAGVFGQCDPRPLVARRDLLCHQYVLHRHRRVRPLDDSAIKRADRELGRHQLERSGGAGAGQRGDGRQGRQFAGRGHLCQYDDLRRGRKLCRSERRGIPPPSLGPGVFVERCRRPAARRRRVRGPAESGGVGEFGSGFVPLTRKLRGGRDLLHPVVGPAEQRTDPERLGNGVGHEFNCCPERVRGPLVQRRGLCVDQHVPHHRRRPPVDLVAIGSHDRGCCARKRL